MTFRPHFLFAADDGASDAGGSSTASTTTGTSTSSVSGTTNQPDYRALAQEWENRAKGWQAKFQAEQAERAALAKSFESLQGEHKTVADQYTGLQTQFNELQPKYQTMEQQLQRLSMITTEFSDLLPFMQGGQDLLPTGQGDDLRTKLAAFKERLSLAQQSQLTAQAEQKKKDAEGVTPPPPNGDVQAKDLLAQATAAARQGNIDEYNKLMDQYYSKTK